MRNYRRLNITNGRVLPIAFGLLMVSGLTAASAAQSERFSTQLPMLYADAAQQLEILIETGQIDPVITGNTTTPANRTPNGGDACSDCGLDQPFPEALKAPLAQSLPDAWVK